MNSYFEVVLNGKILIYKTTVEADAYAKFKRAAAELETSEKVDFLQNGSTLESYMVSIRGDLMRLDHTSEKPEWIDSRGRAVSVG